LLIGSSAYIKGLVRSRVLGPIGAIGKGEYQVEIIIGGDSDVPMYAAAQTTMDDCVLAIRTDEVADWGHQRAAIAGPVAGPPAVHMPGVQARGAVVSLPAP
jgi:hypothetical protein